MKKAFILFTLALFCSLALNAQDARLAGVWKNSRDSGLPDVKDLQEYIRIDIEDNHIYVSEKMTRKVDGEFIQTYAEAENITVNPDGSISFDIYLSKNEYDNQDHLYWDVWEHYFCKLKGSRLYVTITFNGKGRDKNGRIVNNGNQATMNYVYYNEKDNW